MRATSMKIVLRGRDCQFANGRILRSYVRRNVLESTALEALPIFTHATYEVSDFAQ